MNNKEKGKLIISLDFELFWGVCDCKSLDEFEQDIKGGRKAIPILLNLFEKFDIHATWGVVGMLFAETKDELKKFLPVSKPKYASLKSAYEHFDLIGESEEKDFYHYAFSLIEKIKKYDNQEIGSHTFSHYYCNEKGQDTYSFEDDIIAAKEIAKAKFDLNLNSLIFPRNQINSEYLKILKKQGFLTVRGNKNAFVSEGTHFFKRILRFIDTYIPICGNKFYDKSECLREDIIDVKGSIFFRKYNHKLRFLESVKLNNIKVQMKKAAQKGKILHIWWHPHNMGRNPDIFLKQVEELLFYYKELNLKYGFESKSMGEFAEELINEKNSNVM